MEQLYAALISAGITIIGGLSIFVTTFLKSKTKQQELETKIKEVNVLIKLKRREL